MGWKTQNNVTKKNTVTEAQEGTGRERLMLKKKKGKRNLERLKKEVKSSYLLLKMFKILKYFQ